MNKNMDRMNSCIVITRTRTEGGEIEWSEEE